MFFLWIIIILVVFIVVFTIYIFYLFHVPQIPHHLSLRKYGIPFSEIKFRSEGNCYLYGWWIPSKNKISKPVPTIILVHGWGCNSDYMIPYIKKLYPYGYNLLTFDLRSHGNSDHVKYPNMLEFSYDIRSAVKFALKQNNLGTGNIGIIGLSIGGSAAIHAAAYDNNIKTIVTVGAFAEPGNVISQKFHRRKIPSFPFKWIIMNYFQYRMKAKFDQIAPLNNIQKTNANILLIHGNNDKVVPPEQGKMLKKAGNQDSVKLWILPDKGHSDCNDHEDFWDKLIFFINSTMSLSH